VDHPRRFGLGQPFSAGRAVHDASIAACVGEGHAWYPTVVDGGRSIVSLLSSPGQHFGLAVVARAIGIVLNNGTMWFDPMPGRVNALAPGRRRVISAVRHSILNMVEPYTGRLLDGVNH
jgi:gamma-glutamyltranspeptidase/glutathione hydrolase